MEGSAPFGWALVVLGVIIVVVGLVFVTGGRIPMLLVSVVVSIVLGLLNRR